MRTLNAQSPPDPSAKGFRRLLGRHARLVHRRGREFRHQRLYVRRSESGDLVVSRSRAESAVATGGDIAETRRPEEGVDHGIEERERRDSFLLARLVDEGAKARPNGRAPTCSADAGRLSVQDEKSASVGIGSKTDVRDAPVISGRHTLPGIRGLVYRQGYEITHSRWESDVQEMIRRLGLNFPEPGGPISIGQGKSHSSVLRAGAGPSTLIITTLALLIIGGVYAFVQWLYVAPEVKTSYWTSWMDQAEYQQEFNKQIKNGSYPNQIEAKLVENVVKYRGHFELYPSANFQFYSRHSLNDDEFSAADAEYIQKGFKRIYQQRIMVGSRAFNQGTWTKP